MLLTTDKRDVWQSKSLQFKDSPFDKLLIYIKNINHPKMDPCGTPMLTFSQDECCPFKTSRICNTIENHIKF